MKLDHIQLAMPLGSEEKARAFFVGLLGMVEEDKPYPLSERGGAWFRDGDVIVHLGTEATFVPQKKAHPAFIIQDLDQLATTLGQANHAVEWDDTLPNRRRFYTADPFGNRIEFIQDGDGFSQPRNPHR